tara:strand:+ start:12271 stop:12900 length:630 start_codon:yes stop_codon:yes gene_type:complete
MRSQKIIVPTKLSEINLGQYQKFSKINVKESNQDFMYKKMVEIFCGIPLQDVDKIKYSSIKNVISKLSKMFDEKPRLINIFKINGKEYGFHPQLSEMTFGEYVDADTYFADWQTMHKAMRVLYRPVKEKFRGSYLIEDYDGNIDDTMKKMPLDAAFGSVFFFYNLRKELLKVILRYSRKKRSQDLMMQMQDFQKNGDGFNPYGVFAKVK